MCIFIALNSGLFKEKLMYKYSVTAKARLSQYFFSTPRYNSFSTKYTVGLYNLDQEFHQIYKSFYTYHPVALVVFTETGSWPRGVSKRHNVYKLVT